MTKSYIKQRNTTSDFSDLYYPVNLTRGDKTVNLVIGPNFILLHPDHYELARHLLDEQKLGYLLGKERRSQEDGLLLFDISEDPQGIHERLMNLDLTVPTSYSAKKIDIFKEDAPIPTGEEKINPRDILAKMKPTKRKHMTNHRVSLKY
jgi:hypothetical protein